MGLQETITCDSPCYRMKPLHVEVRNPYFKGGHFRVLLIERGGIASGREALNKSDAGAAPAAAGGEGGGEAGQQRSTRGARESRLQPDKAYWDVLSTLWRAKQQGKQKQRKAPVVQPRIRKSLTGATSSNRAPQTPATENASVTTVRTGPSNGSFQDSGASMRVPSGSGTGSRLCTGLTSDVRCAEEGGGEQAATGPTLASFSCRQTSVFLGANASDVIEINFLPFSPGNKFAVLVLSNAHVGEFLYTIDAEARLPMATGIPFRDDEGSARIPDPRSKLSSFSHLIILSVQ